MKLLQKTDSLKTGYFNTGLSGFMGKYTIKKNYGKRCEKIHKACLVSDRRRCL